MPCTIVVGLGRSGIGAARLLHHQGEAVVLLERGNSSNHHIQAEQLRGEQIQVELNCPLELESFQPWFNQLDTVVIGPGIPWDHPTLNELRQRNVTVRGEMDLAWDALRHIPWVGITGTNGKTTVTHLLSHVLQRAGLNAPMGGNMGISAAEMARQIISGEVPTPDWLVMELSSYQIEAAPGLSPKIGIWTTLTPDHLERHGTLEAYRAIKRGLLERSELAILNADDPDLRQQRQSWDGGVWVSAQAQASEGQQADLWIDGEGMVHESGSCLFPAAALSMPGEHNRQNLLLVTAAARAIGLNAEQIEQGLRSFPGVPHRLERLGRLGEAAVFNDSKATNYDAAEVALKAMPRPVVVLAGGQTKRGDAKGWLNQLKQTCCSVVLFGAGADELDSLLQQSGYSGEVQRCGDLEHAVIQAAAAVERQQAKALLLSPACASFDQYKDFEARGEHFRSLIKPLLRSD